MMISYEQGQQIIDLLKSIDKRLKANGELLTINNVLTSVSLTEAQANFAAEALKKSGLA